MFNWFARKSRERRAQAYLRSYPDDAVAVEAILVIVETLNPKNARHLASMVAGREISDVDWGQVGPRWERAWRAII
jgi:hypothetical protein